MRVITVTAAEGPAVANSTSSSGGTWALFESLAQSPLVGTVFGAAGGVVASAAGAVRWLLDRRTQQHTQAEANRLEERKLTLQENADQRELLKLQQLILVENRKLDELQFKMKLDLALALVGGFWTWANVDARAIDLRAVFGTLGFVVTALSVC